MPNQRNHGLGATARIGFGHPVRSVSPSVYSKVILLMNLDKKASGRQCCHVSRAEDKLVLKGDGECRVGNANLFTINDQF